MDDRTRSNRRATREQRAEPATRRASSGACSKRNRDDHRPRKVTRRAPIPYHTRTVPPGPAAQIQQSLPATRASRNRRRLSALWLRGLCSPVHALRHRACTSLRGRRQASADSTSSSQQPAAGPHSPMARPRPKVTESTHGPPDAVQWSTHAVSLRGAVAAAREPGPARAAASR